MPQMGGFEPKIAVDLGFQVKVNRGRKSEMKIAGKAVKLFPKDVDSRKPKRVILNLHGQKEQNPSQKFVGKPLFLPTAKP
jgi:hypothetical protein